MLGLEVEPIVGDLLIPLFVGILENGAGLCRLREGGELFADDGLIVFTTF